MAATCKRILLFSDGTGNSVLKGRGTNVFKLYEAVDLAGHRYDPELTRQIAFYDDGVGTEVNKVFRILGGAFGFGLSRNVKELYTALCRTYQPGDEIYLFGFSRGAFTVRTLAGLITECGVIQRAATLSDSELNSLVRQAYRAFRQHFWRRKPRQAGGETRGQAATRWFREQHARDIPGRDDRRVPIRFLGVWDTVAAVGFPIAHVAAFWNAVIYPFQFPDHKLSPLVTKACHALAIDDERHTFHPLLWDEREETTDRIEQVWFAGVHSNVGGGYLKQGLSLISLEWMMLKAAAQGLRFNQGELERFRGLANAHDKLYNSRSGLATYYRYKPRDIAGACHAAGVLPKVHVSALERIALGTQGYAPGNLPEVFDLVPSDLRGKAPGEDPETLQGLVRGFGGSAAHRPLLLHQVRSWVHLRRGIHYLLVALSLGVVAYGLYLSPAARQVQERPLPDWVEGGLRKVLGVVPFVGARLYDHVLLPFLVYPRLGIGLLAVGLAIYLLSKLAHRTLERRYSTFWRGALPGDWRR